MSYRRLDCIKCKEVAQIGIRGNLATIKLKWGIQHVKHDESSNMQKRPAEKGRVQKKHTLQFQFPVIHE